MKNSKQYCSKTEMKRDYKIFERVEFTPISDGYQLLGELTRIEKKILSSKKYTVGRDKIDNCKGIDTNQTNNMRHDNNQKKNKYLNINNLIILDSASGCLALDLYNKSDGGAGSSITSEVALTLRRLARISRLTEFEFSDNFEFKYLSRVRCAVFITNGIVSSDYFSQKTELNSRKISNSGIRGYEAELGEIWKAFDARIRLNILFDENKNMDNPEKEKIKNSTKKSFNIPTSELTYQTSSKKNLSVRWVEATLEKKDRRLNYQFHEKASDKIVFGISKYGIINNIL